MPLLEHDDKAVSTLIQNEMGRFRVWAANLAAHRRGRISLDYRLRYADREREAIISLLNDLDHIINEGMSKVVTGIRTECNFLPLTV